MSAFDAARLAALARRLDASPRHTLVAAARLARATTLATGVPRTAILREAQAAAPFAAGAGALLATPIAAFAQDETDRAFAVLWPSPPDA